MAKAEEYAAQMDSALEVALDTARSLASPSEARRRLGSPREKPWTSCSGAPSRKRPSFSPFGAVGSPTPSTQGRGVRWHGRTRRLGRFVPLWIRAGGALERRPLRAYDQPGPGTTISRPESAPGDHRRALCTVRRGRTVPRDKPRRADPLRRQSHRRGGGRTSPWRTFRRHQGDAPLRNRLRQARHPLRASWRATPMRPGSEKPAGRA